MNRIMIVEDRESISGIIRDMLILNGFEVVAEASNGSEALRLFNEKRPGVVLMDLLLPDINGLEVTRRILEIEPSTKVIAITALAKEGLIEESLKAGCTRFIMKPFRMRELVEVIKELHGGSTR